MVIYRERLTPNLGWHIALLLLFPLGLGMLAPIDVTWGIINAIVLYSIGVLWFTLGAPQVVVTTEQFRAGRATIDRSLLGEVAVVERVDRKDALSDARSWKVIRAWIPRGVKVEINDPEDPTPYWYVSTRRPEKLVEALVNA